MVAVLLVASNPGAAEGARRVLQQLGHEVTTAPGSLYALTLLERNRSDVLIAWPDVGEPTAEELCTILRQDPAMEAIRLILVRPPGLPPPSVPEVVVVALQDEGELERELARQVLLLRPKRPGAPVADTKEPGPDAGGLVGRLDTIQLVNLVQALSQLRRTGCLRVLFQSAESSSYFLEGKLIHATFGALSGEPAFHESIVEAEVQPGALFSFDRYDPDRIEKVPRTVTSRLEKVILEASAHLDSRRAQSGEPGAE